MNNKFTVNDLNLYYGDFHALKNINLDIKEKEITAFIGPSGCGKSTFLKTLNRMNDLVESTKITGDICLDGTDIYKNMDAIELRRRVGMVFQQPNPFPKSIYDNIAYGPRIFGIKKKSELDEIVERSLRQAAIWDEVKDRLHKSALGMSGGQQQRLCIARALAMQPEVLLMDEPTSALDPISTSKIEELTLELKKDYTIVIVTHNMQHAMRISDNTAFFLLGDLIEYSDTEALFSTPKEKKTEDQMENTLANKYNESLFTPLLTAKIVIGAIIKSLVMLIIFIYFAKKADVNTAGSLLFIYLVTHELLFSFSCRNIKKSVLNKNIFSNKKLTLGVFLILLVQVIVLVTPISKYFIVPNIKINYILITIGICFIMFILGELVKPVYTKLFKDYREVKNEKQ